MTFGAAAFPVAIALLALLHDAVAENDVFCVPASLGPDLFRTAEGRAMLTNATLNHAIHHQRYTLQTHELPFDIHESLVSYGDELVGTINGNRPAGCPDYQVLPWSAASAADGAAGPRHQDKQSWVVRAVFGITTSGKKRKIKIDGKGYQTSWLEPESGGGYVLSPFSAGSSRGPRSPLFHTVQRLDSDNLNFMIDFHCASEADANELHKIIHASIVAKKAAAASAGAPSPPLPPLEVGKLVNFTTNVINTDLDPHSVMFLQFYFRLCLDALRPLWVFDRSLTPAQQIALVQPQCGKEVDHYLDQLRVAISQLQTQFQFHLPAEDDWGGSGGEGADDGSDDSDEDDDVEDALERRFYSNCGHARELIAQQKALLAGVGQVRIARPGRQAGMQADRQAGRYG